MTYLLKALTSAIVLSDNAALAAITLLTGAAVAACGPIAFLGLVVAHVARFLTGPDYRWLLPAAGPSGAVLLLTAGRDRPGGSSPWGVAGGLVLALVGGPFFLALVHRRSMVRL